MTKKERVMVMLLGDTLVMETEPKYHLQLGTLYWREIASSGKTWA